MQSISKEKLVGMFSFVIERTILAINRTADIHTADDFLMSPEGMDRLDATCMRMQTIGEVLKQIDKLTNRNLLKLYPAVPWRSVFGMRNIISHEYIAIDPEELLDTLRNDFPLLLATLEQIKEDINVGKHEDLFSI